MCVSNALLHGLMLSRNGDPGLSAQTVVVTTRGLTFDVLLDRVCGDVGNAHRQLTARLKPSFGAVRRIFSVEGARIATLEGLHDGECLEST